MYMLLHSYLFSFARKTNPSALYPLIQDLEEEEKFEPNLSTLYIYDTINVGTYIRIGFINYINSAFTKS